MINRNTLKGWLAFVFVVLLAIPSIGWNTLSKSTSSSASEGNRTSETTTLESIAAQSSPIGNAESGRDMFMGRLHFENDGPPCMGCHNIGENGLLGGGAMGPDLTDISTRRTQAEMLGILSNTGQVVSPVMQPIFTEHPLTEGEQADLVAFMEASAGQPESNKEILVLGISLAGFVAAVVVLGIVYRNRLRGVRKALVKQGLAENNK